MAATLDKMVYEFRAGHTEGDKTMKPILGGKGAGLAEMAKLGMPVPPGFTITTVVCDYYNKHNSTYPDGLNAAVDTAVTSLEQVMGKKFGDTANPLLVSVRSGAADSMPGMMDTVLNLGLNDLAVEGLIKLTSNPRFALDSYRRFIHMYGNVVKGLDAAKFEENLTKMKTKQGVQFDADLSAESLRELIQLHKATYKALVGEEFPQNPRDQLWGAITAVFGSWNNARAIKYREIHNIRGLLGTAVNVQSMVFGNMGPTSATGVCFSRNPSTGDPAFYGEWLINAQGEDVVAGIRTPQQITLVASKKWAEENQIAEADRAAKFPSLEEAMPECYAELLAVRAKLEGHFRDMQDIEFTIENKKLFILQCRNGKRTVAAKVRIAVDMVAEGVITKDEALLRVEEPTQLDQLLHPMLAPSKSPAISKGLAASPGGAVGQIVFNSEDAESWVKSGKKVVLLREETCPEDIGGMHVAEGILTARGGMTSHAAVVARGMGVPCVAGCGTLHIDYANKTAVFQGTTTLREGDWISIDGTSGNVYAGQMPTIKPEIAGAFGTFIGWAKGTKKLGVRANADTPKDADTALGFGAEGIGLVRTEHMFFAEDRILAVRQMILAEDQAGRVKALEKILPMQRSDFIGIFKSMKGFPVTIRLLDPPLHEFVPSNDEDIAKLAADSQMDAAVVKQRILALHEANPMMGHRGCRLGITYPEIYNVQVRAIIQAAIAVQKETGLKIVPEIMIPLIGKKEELAFCKRQALETIQTVFAEEHVTVDYMIGTMIEVPRAAVTADKIAEEAEFFSFGTNDLTQMGCGFSRDDAGSFLRSYVKLGIFENDPFEVLDTAGVGELMKIALKLGKSVRPDIKTGICGEHGGNPPSVAFCHDIGLSYVSCSPFRVPIAILAAAQAQIRKPR